MASHATVLHDTPGAIVVRVEHNDNDSFSRSVDRAAKKAWAGSRNARTATYTKGKYGLDMADWPRKCYSVVVFATSFDAADKLLREFLGRTA